MKDLVFITGNQYKADYLATWLGHPVERQALDLDELQSLDPHEVVEHKVKAAYNTVQRPVLVEDVSLVFYGMGRLPGTLIKWFLTELGLEKLCALGNSLDDKTAQARVIYALHDGHEMHLFEGVVEGMLAPEPRGEGHGWNPLFIPEGHTKTYAEMSPEEFNATSHRGIALAKLKAYLDHA